MHDFKGIIAYCLALISIIAPDMLLILIELDIYQQALIKFDVINDEPLIKIRLG